MLSRGPVTGVTLFCCCFFFLLATIIPITNWQLVFHSDRYHGHHVQRGMFFEGWYYNMVLATNSRTIVVIPGVLMNDDDRHSFVMVAYDNVSHYFRFPFEAFHSSPITDEFHVSISRKNDNKNHTNIFSASKIIVDIEPNQEDDATDSIQMNLTIFSTTQPKDLSWLTPGTMGPFSWVSIMQCYHHVISMRHVIHGTIQLGQHVQTIVSGVGYLEKDWGRSFPSIWIWGQTNQWISTVPVSASLFFSFASVPVGFGFQLPGFLVIFEHNNQFYHFNTHLLSIIHNLVVNNRTNRLSFTVYDLFFEYKLSVNVRFNDTNTGVWLYAPRQGRMEKFVNEMLDSHAHFDVRLSKLIPVTSIEENADSFVPHGYREHVLFEARTQHVALEINGDVLWLSEQFSKIYEKTCPWCFSLIRTLIQHYRFVLFLTTTLLLVTHI